MNNLSNVNKPIVSSSTLQTKNVSNKDLSLALLSKVNSRKTDNKRNYTQPLPELTQMAMDHKMRIASADDILALFPDANLAIDIIVSCILSPNDMTTVNLTYNFPELPIPDLTKQKVTNHVKDYISNNYKLEQDLRDMITEAMFTKGSYVTVIIPEASFDDMINEVSFSMESYFNKNKINRYISTENYDYRHILQSKNEKLRNTKISISDLINKIEITDDFYFVKDKGSYLRTVSREGYNEYTKRKKKNNYSFSNEDMVVDYASIFNNKKSFKREEYLEVKDRNSASRRSIGKPLYFKVPPESIIPIYPKGEPNNHIGYFLMVDERGLPLSLNKDEITTPTSGVVNGKNQPMYGSPIERTANSFDGIFKTAKEYENMEEVFSEILEKNIKHKLEKGKFGDLLTTEKHNQIYRIMFNRALESKETKLIYLPEEMVSYFAYNYRPNGTGESVFETVITHYSIRAILLFSKVNANIKNSVPVTQVTVRIPEEDPDPLNTFEMVKDMTLSDRKSYLPLGVIDSTSLSEWLHKAGYEFKLEHGKLSDLNIEYTDVNKDIRIPDQEFDEWINSLILCKFGLTPEMIKPAMEPEFATTLLSRNLNLAKRAKQDQDTTAFMLSDLIRKLIRNDQTLSSNIRNILFEDIKDIRNMLVSNQEDSEYHLEKATDEGLIEYILETCEDEFSIKLPEIQTSEAPAAFNAMKYKFEIYDEAINGIFDEQLFGPEVVGDMSNYITPIKAMLLGYLKRNYIAENDIIPELVDIFRPTDEVNPAFVNFNSVVKSLFGNYLKYISGNKDITILSKALSKATEEMGLDSSGSDDYGDSDSDNSDDSGNDDFGSDDSSDTEDTGGDTNFSDGDFDTSDTDEGTDLEEEPNDVEEETSDTKEQEGEVNEPEDIDALSEELEDDTQDTQDDKETESKDEEEMSQLFEEEKDKKEKDEEDSEEDEDVVTDPDEEDKKKN